MGAKTAKIMGMFSVLKLPLVELKQNKSIQSLRTRMVDGSLKTLVLSPQRTAVVLSVSETLLWVISINYRSHFALFPAAKGMVHDHGEELKEKNSSR